MTIDDEAARRARAEGLRQRIAALRSDDAPPEESEVNSETSGPQTEQTPSDETPPTGESPRDFVQRRMRELDRDKAESDVSDT